ncbi:hypothetical protein [Sphingopyxis sp.]|uniref:hypothetical protein n=1 Tax=Sphingopyxis sp. TaxID=1908224 RepID=UPI003D6D850B
MTKLIETYLKNDGPALSSDVAAYLVDQLGITPATARQRVSRASGDVKRLGGIVFPHRSRFLYLQGQFGSPWYWDRLGRALIDTNSAYGFAIAALRQRGGIVPAREFQIVSGAPMKLQKHLSPSTIFTRLQEAGLLEQVIVPGSGECIALIQSEGHYEFGADNIQARRITENILLAAVKDWLKKMGIASYGKVALRTDDEIPQVGTFAWDLTAPCYLGPMVRKSAEGKVKPGFVVCDVHLGDKMTRDGVEPFIRKCLTLRSLQKVGPCMQIFVADSYSKDAFQLLKKNGIMPATPATMFGQEIAEALRELTIALQLAAVSVIDADRFEALFNALGKIEGAAIQLRGTLFEFMAAEIARKLISPSVTMNRIFKEPGGKAKAEGDVVAVKPGQAVTVIECKGWSPRAELPDEYLKRWLQISVPLMYKEIRAHPDWKDLDAIFEFWTTATLSPESLLFFANAKAKIKPSRYSIGLRLGNDVRNLCEATRDGSLITAFDKHYTKPEKYNLDWGGHDPMVFEGY